MKKLNIYNHNNIKNNNNNFQNKMIFESIIAILPGDMHFYYETVRYLINNAMLPFNIARSIDIVITRGIEHH